MDEIVVLDKGIVAERGRFRELLDNQGLFHKLWSLQQDVIV